MKNYLFATYSDKSYIPFLDCCLEGCERFLGERPMVYALDAETLNYVRGLGGDALRLESEQLEPHVSSLKILKKCEAEVLVMIDADCWPLLEIDLSALTSNLLESSHAGIGDVGRLDIPYLFKTVNEDKLFELIHDTFAQYPKFAQKWISSPLLPAETFSTGTVVDLPLLYGGFAGYRVERFQELPLPSWIHSADIWLSMFAVEHGLTFEKWKNFQFNRRLDMGHPFMHLAGPKPPKQQISLLMENYRHYLRKT